MSTIISWISSISSLLDDKGWTTVTAIAAGVYTLAFIGSIFFVWRQLRTTKAAMFSQSFAVAAGMVNAPDVVRARDMVWERRNEPANTRFHRNVDGPTGVTVGSRRDYAAKVCRTYRDLGAMVQHRMLPAEVVLETYPYCAGVAWYLLP